MMYSKKSVTVMFLIFRDLRIKQRDLPKMRGFLAKYYPKIIELHNHLDKGSYDYRYPLIQFRIIDGCGALMALDSAIIAMNEILFHTEEFEIENLTIKSKEKELHLNQSEIGVTDESYRYRFNTPWMALKEANYQRYIMLSESKKEAFLCLLLRENLKTLSKGCNYTIADIEKIKTKVNLRPVEVNFKNQIMLCFKGSFQVNFAIPEYFALGKQVSRGFGVVRKFKG